MAGHLEKRKEKKMRGAPAIRENPPRSGRLDRANPRTTAPNVLEVLRTEASRPISNGVKHRGDRRDTSKTYTGNTRHSARGNSPRPDVKTRAR